MLLFILCCVALLVLMHPSNGNSIYALTFYFCIIPGRQGFYMMRILEFYCSSNNEVYTFLGLAEKITGIWSLHVTVGKEFLLPWSLTYTLSPPSIAHRYNCPGMLKAFRVWLVSISLKTQTSFPYLFACIVDCILNDSRKWPFTYPKIWKVQLERGWLVHYPPGTRTQGNYPTLCLVCLLPHCAVLFSHCLWAFGRSQSPKHCLLNRELIKPWMAGCFTLNLKWP